MKIIEIPYEQRQPAQNEAWDTIISELDGVTVFNHYVWYDCLARNAPLRNCVQLTLENDGRVVGLFPLLISRQREHGFPTRRHGFIEDHNTLHNEFLVHPSARKDAIAELIAHLFGKQNDWDVLVFKNLSRTSVNYKAFTDVLTEMKLSWLERPGLDSPYLVPSGSWEEYLSSRSPKTRKTLRNIENNLAKAGSIEVRLSTTWNEYDEVREAVFGVAQQSWTAGIGDSLASPGNRSFFEDLTREAAARGWLMLWTLHVNDKVVAFEYHLRAFGTEHALRGSYLPEYHDLSPGTYLEMRILKHVFSEQERVRKYDFGGSFDSYKRKWTKDHAPHCEIVVFGPRPYSRLLAVHEKYAVPGLRSIRDRLRRIRKVGVKGAS